MSATPQSDASVKKFLRRPSVRARYDVSDSWITTKMRDEGFPKPRRLGLNSRDVWLVSELDAWDAAQLTDVRTIVGKPPSRALQNAQRRATEEGLAATRFRR
jgi:predicted DNA-binding transcriptional regulator AlpA